MLHCGSPIHRSFLCRVHRTHIILWQPVVGQLSRYAFLAVHSWLWLLPLLTPPCACSRGLPRQRRRRPSLHLQQGLHRQSAVVG
jgi:hypothetical protein